MNAGKVRYRRADHHVFATLVKEDERVLDIGCGDGELMELLRNERGVDARGLEISPQGVGKCLLKGLPVVQGDAEKDLQVYPDDAFDCAILSRAIQNMQHPQAILRELWRIAPRLLASIHNYGHWRTRLALLVAGRIATADAGKYPCSLLDMIDMAADAGYELQRSIPVGGGGGGSAWQNLCAREVVLVLRRRPKPDG